LIKEIRNEKSYVLPWKAYDFWTWLFWDWARIYSKNLDRLEVGFRILGFTHIREWVISG